MRKTWTCFMVVALTAIALGSGDCSGQGDITVGFMNFLLAVGTKKPKTAPVTPPSHTTTIDVFADSTKAWNASGFGFDSLSGKGKKVNSRKYTTTVSNTPELFTFATDEIAAFNGQVVQVTKAKLSATAAGNKTKTVWTVSGTITISGTVTTGADAGKKFKSKLKLTGTSSIFG